MLIQPLSARLQQQVIERTDMYIDKATELFNTRRPAVDINFSLKGRAAGMYRVRQQHWLSMNSKREIRYNPFIFAKYYEDNYTTTIPHEVAHYVSDIIYGLKNIRPHGKEWKLIMQEFGADTAVTANYDLSGIPLKRQSFHIYQCGCQEHRLSSTRHNRITRKRHQYFCNLCKQTIRYKQEETRTDKG